MSAYLIVELEVTDPEGFERYRAQVPATIEGHGGRYIVRGGRVETLEGGWAPRRLVILEFPDMDRAAGWYGSDAYAPLKALRRRSARTDALMVEGLPGVAAGQRSGGPASGFVLAEVTVNDVAGYEPYRQQVGRTIEAMGGRSIVRVQDVAPLEGSWSPGRLVLLEFDSMDKAMAWYRSDVYRPVMDIRLKTASTRLLVAEGVT